MEIISIIGIWIFGGIFLYLIIRAAVRDGILKADQQRRHLEAQIALWKAQEENKDAMGAACFKCGKVYPAEHWPKCPICSYKE